MCGITFYEHKIPFPIHEPRKFCPNLNAAHVLLTSVFSWAIQRSATADSVSQPFAFGLPFPVRHASPPKTRCSVHRLLNIKEQNSAPIFPPVGEKIGTLYSCINVSIGCPNNPYESSPAPIAARVVILYFLRNVIWLRSCWPTLTSCVSAFCFFIALKCGLPTRFSKIQSRANVPS